MASSPSTEAIGLSWRGSRGEWLDWPREWEPAYLVIEDAPRDWHGLRVTRGGQLLPVSERRVGEHWHVVAEWPRSNPGRYQLQLSHQSTPVSFEVKPGKMSMDSFQAMLDDLHGGLPADVILSLQRAGGLAGVNTSDVRPPSIPEEFSRLRQAVKGDGMRPGLQSVLPLIARQPHLILEGYTVTVRPELLKRPRPADLTQALARCAGISSGRSVRLPDERVRPSVDVYENRIVRHCLDLVTQRLLALQGRGGSLLALQVQELLADLHLVRQQARFLQDVGPLTGPPSRLTMVLLKRQEYRAVLELLLELQRSRCVTLDDERLQEPMQNLPALYQMWCTLQVIQVLLELAPEQGFMVTRQRLARPVKGGLLLQVLPDGEPLVELQHLSTNRKITLTSERTFRRRSHPLHSISFNQRPDISIELTQPGKEPQLWLFDPKYKLDSELYGGVLPNEDVTGGRPQKVDIDKMHAYRDAIRTDAGELAVQFAGILYPGRNQTFDTGLAAISARPGLETNLRQQIQVHLRPLVLS